MESGECACVCTCVCVRACVCVCFCKLIVCSCGHKAVLGSFPSLPGGKTVLPPQEMSMHCVQFFVCVVKTCVANKVYILFVCLQTYYNALF